MAIPFDITDYKDEFVMLDNGPYLSVSTAIKVLLDAGMLLGSETEITETPEVVRAKVRIKVLNKHIPDWEKLRPEDQIGYYEGVAETPFDDKKAKGSGKLFPVETAETSAIGRAMRMIGASTGTCSAEEMALIDVKDASTVGNGRRPHKPGTGGRGGGGAKTASVKQLNYVGKLLAQQGAKTDADANTRAAELLGRDDVIVASRNDPSQINLTGREASTIIESLKDRASF